MTHITVGSTFCRKICAKEPLSSIEFARCWSKSAHVRSSERTAEEQRRLGNGCWLMDFIGDTRLCVVRSIICWWCWSIFAGKS